MTGVLQVSFRDFGFEGPGPGFRELSFRCLQELVFEALGQYKKFRMRSTIS